MKKEKGRSRKKKPFPVKAVAAALAAVLAAAAAAGPFGAEVVPVARQDYNKPLAVLAGLAVLTAAGIVALTANGGFGVPGYRPAVAGEVEALQAALTRSQAQVQGDDPWDRTIAYSFLDDAHAGMLYAAPTGMGVQFDENSYLADTSHSIYSRYIMTGPGSAVEQRLLAEGWELLYQGEYCTVYERP